MRCGMCDCLSAPGTERMGLYGCVQTKKERQEDEEKVVSGCQDRELKGDGVSGNGHDEEENGKGEEDCTGCGERETSDGVAKDLPKRRAKMRNGHIF